jgi:predicted ATP-grasp superfamily ATP-dependent carboligase
MTRKVLLVTTVDWMSTARYAGAFKTASWTVGALSPPKAPVALSRYVDRHYRYRPLTALRSLRAAIARAMPDLIVPCDDRAVSLALRLYAKEKEETPVKALIRRSLGTPEEFATILSRAGSMRAAADAGVSVPETIAVADEAALERALARLGLPAVLKADGSWGGDGVIVAYTKDEALAALRKLKRPASRLRNVARAWRRKDAHFLLAALNPPAAKISVQKFISGPSSASAFACWKGEVVGALYYDVLISDGAMGPPNVIRRVDCPQMAEASRAIARRFGLTGIYGLDFIRDEAGSAHLIEINPRTTQGGTLAFGEGRDLPSALAAAVMRAPAQRREAIASDIVAFFPNEWQRDAASPYLAHGHHNVPWDDPAVLKQCFDSLPASATPSRRAAVQMLLTTAPKHEMSRLAPVFE